MAPLCEIALEKALAVLSSECSLIGLMESPEGYPHVWACDSVIASLSALLSPGHENCLRVSLESLAGQQSELDAIPNNVSVATGRLVHTNAGSIDSNLWFILGHAFQYRSSKDLDFLRRTWPALEKALLWLRYQDSNGCGLLELHEAADWADLLANRFNILYDNVFWYASLREMADMAIDLGDKNQFFENMANDVQHKISRVLWVGVENEEKCENDVPGHTEWKHTPSQVDPVVADFIFPEPGTNISNHFKIRKGAEGIEWGKKDPSSSPTKRRGKGIAFMWKAPAMPPNTGSSARVDFNEDGTITVAVGSQDIGQGAFTVMAQMAAAALGVPYEWVRIALPVNTDYSLYEWQTVASRLTWSMGNAVVIAARDARKKVLDLVAQAWKENPDYLDIIDGQVISYKSEECVSLKNIVVYGMAKPGDQGWIGGPIVGHGSFMPTYVTGLDPETDQGSRSVVHYTTGAKAAEVEVDLETRRVEVIRGVAAFDVGKAINPEQVRVQREGGFVQGVSTALFEALRYKEGIPQNTSFADYRIATSSDIPQEIKTFIVEVPQDGGPCGARGIGEHPMVPTIPAVANAIYDAIGLRPESPHYTKNVYLAMVEAGIVE